MSCGILGIFASEKQFLLRNLAEKFSSSRHFASGSSIRDFLNGSLLGGHPQMRIIRSTEASRQLNSGDIGTDETFYEHLGKTRGQRNMFVSFMQERGATTVISPNRSSLGWSYSTACRGRNS